MARHNGGNKTAHWQEIGLNVDAILDVCREVEKQSKLAGRVVRLIGRLLAMPRFFLFLLVAHLGWVVLNLPWMPWTGWDPYPFDTLTVITALEAPFLTLLVLMHQQREQRIDELRDEINLQVSLHVERQATMLLWLLLDVQREMNVTLKEDDKALQHMTHYLDPEHMLKNLRQRLREDQGKNSDYQL